MSRRRARELAPLGELAPGVGVLVADDCHEFRQLVCDALRRTPGIGLVVEAARAMEAVVQAGWYRPEVVLLDFDLGGSDADRMIRDINAQLPAAALVGFSGYDSDFLRPAARAMLSLHLDKRTPLHQVAERVLELGRATAAQRRRVSRVAAWRQPVASPLTLNRIRH
jgi:DNA-binding NarL/FixJ family response regulator